MREIKFRGRPRGAREYVYGSLLMSEGRPFIVRQETDGKYSWSVEPGSVGQWTEFKDRDGADIYEGDRLWMLDAFHNGRMILRVVWHCGAYILTADRDDATREGCKRLNQYRPRELQIMS